MTALAPPPVLRAGQGLSQLTPADQMQFSGPENAPVGGSAERGEAGS